MRSQEKLVEKHWPWYAEEMHGVAEAINGKHEDVLLLNLRACAVRHLRRTTGAGLFQSGHQAGRRSHGLRRCAGRSDRGLLWSRSLRRPRQLSQKALVARRDDADPASIHNSGSIHLTYACPQAAKTILWILQPKGPAGNHGFVPFAV